MSLQSIHDRHAEYMDSQLRAFTYNLEQMVRNAQDRTIDELMRRLVIKDGKIARTLANRRLIRDIDTLFMDAMERLGFAQLRSAFVSQFPNQLPFMKETLDLLASQAKIKLPALDFTKQDKATLAQLQVLSSESIEAEVAAQAARLSGRVLFGVGGLPFQQLAAIIRNGFGMTTERAEALADTTQAAYYRTMLDRQYTKIEAFDKKELSYQYSGPRDKRNRPFCSHLLAVKKIWTRAQIDEMDNGVLQPKPVWLFCGGYLCRHQWIPDFSLVTG